MNNKFFITSISAFEEGSFMLRTFFVCLWILIFVFFICEYIVNFFVVRNFLNKSEAIIEIYKILKKHLVKNIKLPEDEAIEITYKKYKLEFSDAKAASIVFEEFINITLEYYEYIVNVGIEDEEIEKQKTKIIQICYELRKIRWLKQ